MFKKREKLFVPMRKCYFITFLTLILLSCKEKQSTTAPVLSANQTKPEVKIITVEPALATAWVDQLRVRSLPKFDSRVLRELSEGDTLFYLNEKTLEKTKLTLRDRTFNQPWLKVRLDNGQEGWVYGGGIRFPQNEK